jgi:hypothetical protein
MSKKLWMLVGAMALLHLAAQGAHAQTVTIIFSSDPGGISLAGTGTPSASLTFGNIQVFGGSVPTGVTKTVNGTTNWTLSTPLDVLVTKSAFTSTSYTLTAQLQTFDPTNTWTLGGLPLSSASAATITLTGSYGINSAYSLALTIPFSAPAGTFSNTINFIAIAN